MRNREGLTSKAGRLLGSHPDTGPCSRRSWTAVGDGNDDSWLIRARAEAENQGRRRTDGKLAAMTGEMARHGMRRNYS